LFQISMGQSRKALHDGIVLTDTTVDAHVGEPATMHIRVCGIRSNACGRAAPGPEGGATPAPAPQVKVGARISAQLTVPGGAVAPAEPAVQPILQETDYGDWYWTVTPGGAGTITALIHLNVLYADTGDQLEPERVMPVTMNVTQAAEPWYGTWPVTLWNGVKGLVGWLLTVATGLGITGASIVRWVRSRRKKQEPADLGEDRPEVPDRSAKADVTRSR
jgi:hypothetical protein